ncbi:COX6C [Branchiostoma lanceolatum]|uniref:COX6C protein n=1 Tax=Branchiostoma lanceolatum TaxID=7740 RepID=A0A8J9ZIH5_BRALA|nr:COX6C [Branchiostoma lanceolatum]
MADVPAGRLPKPQMRGLLISHLKRHGAIALVFSMGVTLAYKLAVADPRKRHYEEFYKNYDVKREFEAMKEAGIFNCARPSWEQAEED